MRPLKIALLTFLFYSHNVQSQVQEQLSPTEKKYQSIVTQPLTLYKGFFRVGVSGQFGLVDKIFNERGKRELIPTNSNASIWTFGSFIQYGITDRLQVQARLPYSGSTFSSRTIWEFPKTNETERDYYNTPRKGFADLQLSAFYQIIKSTDKKPVLGLQVMSILPTGQKNPTKVDPTNPQNYSQAPGGGEFGLDTYLTTRVISFPYSWDFGVGYRRYFGGHKKFYPTDSTDIHFQKGAQLYAAASFNLHLNNWVILKNGADIYHFGRDRKGTQVDESYWLATLYPGLSFQVRSFRIGMLVVFPLAGKIAPADPSYQMNLEYIF